MIKLKSISKEVIPKALANAEHYRLLNEPLEAESICLDVLETDPDNQDALILLLLARTDKFPQGLNPTFEEAREVLPRLSDKFCTAYYSGIIYERRAKVHLERDDPRSGHIAYDWFVKAMEAYREAWSTCSPGNEDAVLRWNTCARIINQHPDVRPDDAEPAIPMLDDWQ